MISELDDIFAEVAERIGVLNSRSTSARLDQDWHPSAERRYRHRVRKDWDTDAIKKHIEAKLSIHHPPPITTWTFRTTGQLIAEVFGADCECTNGFRARFGRAMSQIVREQAVRGMRRQLRDGRMRYLVPLTQ